MFQIEDDSDIEEEFFERCILMNDLSNLDSLLFINLQFLQLNNSVIFDFYFSLKIWVFMNK